MTVLTPKKPFESKEPVIIVDELPIGAHVIRLVVVDDDGNSSDPFDATVEVTEKGFVLPIDTTPPKVITTIPVPGDSITQVPITTIDAVPLTDVLKAAPVAKPTKTVKTTKPPATSKPTKPTNTKPGDQK
jgi:hypothetical protein